MKDECRRQRSVLRASSLALLLFAILGVPLHALEVPPPPAQWVTDQAGILSPTEEDLLNTKLRNFEQETGAQFIVYTLPSLQGGSLEDFTIRAVERWKVGQKKYDNGLVLFVFAEDRRTRVEVGYGLEGTITDAVSSRVLREHLRPHFQQGNYAAGLNAAADELMRRIRTGEAPVEPLQRPQGPHGEREDIGIIPVLVILFILFFVIAPMFGGRRRRGGCNGCIFPFFFFPGGGMTLGGGGGGFGGGGFGGFSGGGGGFGGGGASGDW